MPWYLWIFYVPADVSYCSNPFSHYDMSCSFHYPLGSPGTDQCLVIKIISLLELALGLYFCIEMSERLLYQYFDSYWIL